MSDSCCICGLVLASKRSNLPEWCKNIRAICRVEHQVEYQSTLSSVGYVDDESATPYYLSVPPAGEMQFYYRTTETTEDPECCYPFHDACWQLLQEINGGIFTDYDTLFRVLKSLHYDGKAHCLRWGHDYYFKDILGYNGGDNEVDIIDRNKTREEILGDPWYFDLKGISVPKHRQKLRLTISHRSQSNATRSRLISLPPEILESIICYLDFHDAQQLLSTSAPFYRQYRDLPCSFWRCMFSGQGETAFAKSLLGPSETLKDWFFIIKSGLKRGPNMASLQNRKRIWKLGVDLITLMRSINEPGRALYGNATLPPLPPDQVRGYVASCLALENDSKGCRELKQVYVPFGSRSSGSLLSTMSPTYIPVSGRRLISGLTFTFQDGRSIDVGYVSRNSSHDQKVTSKLFPNLLWLVLSRQGLGALSLDTYPQHDISQSAFGHDIGVCRWPLDRLSGIFLGLDAMRIVRIGAEGIEPDGLDHILWKPPHPVSVPSLSGSDMSALCELQKKSFAPASSLHMEPEKGSLIAIRVFSQLGSHAGINAIQFVYSTGPGTPWGSTDSSASLSFFLDKTERVTQVTIYKIGSIVHHIQFVTSVQRASVFPPLQANSELERAYYKPSHNGHIEGFCGCFLASSMQLNCLGVFASTPVAPLELERQTFHASKPLDDNVEGPLGGFWSHGEHQSRVLFTKRYRSVQASLYLADLEYRSAGHVAGLLFRLSDDTAYPDLLGQWTDTSGPIYSFYENETILDLSVTTTRPRRLILSRPALSQVVDITLRTNLRKICLGQETIAPVEQEIIGMSHSKHRVIGARWDFNAIFDRVRCIYEKLEGKYNSSTK